MIKRRDLPRCKECGDGVCICGDDDGGWAAHCMTCDNTIGRRGYYDPCAGCKEQAQRMWIKLNE